MEKLESMPESFQIKIPADQVLGMKVVDLHKPKIMELQFDVYLKLGSLFKTLCILHRHRKR